MKKAVAIVLTLIFTLSYIFPAPENSANGSGNRVLAAGTASPGLSYYADKGYAALEIKNASLLGGTDMNKKLYTEKYDLTGKKYTMVFSGGRVKLSDARLEIKDSFIESIEVKNNKNTAETSIVFNARDKFFYDALPKPDINGAVIRISKAGEAPADDKAVRTNPLEIEYSAGEGKEEVFIRLDRCDGYSTFFLENLNRIVLDMRGVEAPENVQQIDVNGRTVKNIKYARHAISNARVIISTAGKTGYYVVREEGGIRIVIHESIYPNLAYVKGSKGASVTVLGLKLGQYDDDFIKELLHMDYLPGDAGYIITGELLTGLLKPGRVEIKDEYLDSLEIRDEGDGRTSLVINGARPYQYNVTVKAEAGSIQVEIGGDDSTPAQDLQAIGINYARGASRELVEIRLENYAGYNYFRLTNPDRIVIDIPTRGFLTGQKPSCSGGQLVKNIRYAQFTKEIFRVVLDTNGQPPFEIREGKGVLSVYVDSPPYKNIQYTNVYDRVGFILKGAKLTEGASDLKNLYTARYENGGKKYIVTFPSHYAYIGTGKMLINDGYLDSVEIVKDTAAGKTSIIFNAKEKLSYNIITRTATGDTAITLLRPALPGERLIVIDAGHGGVESGAVHGGLMEKDLNLDIALRLNELLKSKGVKTYMIRETDTYVGLYERCYISNKLGATLFLSIHNNAYYSNHSGTETLYYMDRVNDTGFSGKRFAQIIQNHLVKALGTYDRKIKARPELVVLKATAMPAALAEVAFLTNPDDNSRLRTEAFRQKAAEALCNAVIQAFEEYN